MSNLNWVNKLQIQVIDEEEGCTIRVEWDNEDPELTEWTNWGEEKQREFILEALETAVGKELDDVLTESVD